MKKIAAFIMLLVGIFLASQLTAQVDSKTQGTGTTTEKKADTKTEKTVPPVQSSKEKPGTTQSGQTTGTQTHQGTTTGTQNKQGTSTGTSTKQGTSTGAQTGTMSSSKALKTGKMLDAGGKLIYSYDELGYIRNAKNRVFCQLTPKGEIIRKRVVVGTAVNGIFQDKFGKEYARIVQDGKVVDANSKAVGTIKDDGTVVDKNGTRLGSAPGVDKNVVVIIYFYKELLDPKAGKSSVK